MVDVLASQAVLPGGVAEFHQAGADFKRERPVQSICNCRCAQTNCPSTIKHRLPLQVLPLFFFSSLALFALRLRSSVVSVLFSLISETALRSRFI